VFLGRITPVMRSFISIPAGVFRARFVPYVWLTLLGSALWCFAFAGAGWAAGASWESFHHAFRFVDYIVALGVVLAVALLGRSLIGRRRRRRDEPDTPGQ
jgi:membrane protein DedA with SNARE-associated domain